METTATTQPFAPPPHFALKSNVGVLYRLGLGCLTFGIGGFFVYRGLANPHPLQGAAIFFAIALLSWAIPAFYSSIFNSNDDEYLVHSSTSMLLGGSVQLLGLAHLFFTDYNDVKVFPIFFAICIFLFAWGLTLIQNLAWGFRKGNSIAWGMLSGLLFGLGIFVWYQFMLSPEEVAEINIYIPWIP